MKEEQKAKLEAVTKRTVNWSKETFTPKRMKKAAGVVLVLAIAGAGGKFALHHARASARLEEARARSTVLQNLAASQNISLLSTDAVKEKVAEALGTTPDAVNFRSVILADKGTKDAHGPKDKDKKIKKDGQHHEKKENRDGRRDRKRAPRGPENGQMPPEGPQSGLRPSENAAAEHSMPQQGKFPAPPQAGLQNPALRPASAPKSGHFPAFYLADCEMGGMNYHFVIDAQNGSVLQTKVHKTGLLSRLFA